MPVVLYRRQKELLDFLSQYIQHQGYAPTLQEIAKAMNLSSLATVHEHLQALEKKKLIKRVGGSNRGIEILTSAVSAPSAAVEIPVIGFIAAGRPLEAIEEPREFIPIPPQFLNSARRNFVLQVKGNSMIDEGILDGDYVICQEQQTANNGDIVVAVLDEGYATLKRYFKEPTRIRLEPANTAMAPIFSRNVAIKGRMVSLYRRYR
ncbi:repressor LexA [candidate division WWE3 bacterium RIFCSPLOWO2_01_FULL_42_11]|uniref:LexA repressor n=1 Tax=candidate division WWE3 bacterium RIFCSPLOWO2_01_FULL_42_11 TaxID=1802627 RepID=A0A1F4VN32_UNCKA|nr:MAG: repressor LexA [candidate division WWE3 bacterium RIFCSPLOWO2_01_FULL_42_11]